MSAERTLQTPTAPPTELDVPVTRYLQILLKRILTVILVSGAIFGLVAVYTLRQPRIYEAKTTLIVELNRPQILGDDVQPVTDLSPADYWKPEQFFETQYNIIRSRTLAQKVVNDLGLENDLEFLGLAQVEDPEELARRLEESDAVKVLLERLEIEPAVDSRIVGLKFRHTNPEIATRVVNAVAETYQQFNADERVESTGRAHRWLTGQFLDVKAKLEQSERALHEFKMKHNILTTSLEDRQNITTQQLMDLSQKLTSARSERLRAAAEVEQIRQVRARAEGVVAGSFDAVIDNPLVQNLKVETSGLRQREAELSSRFLDDHPDLIAVRRQLEIVQSDRDLEIDTILAAAENRLRVLQRTESGIQQELESVKQEALDLNAKELEYAELERDYQNNERLYTLVLKREKETDLARFLRDNNVRILDAALTPERPVLPRVWLNLLIGAVVGLAAGVALAFVREMLDNTVRTQSDVEERLGMTFLGLIPLFNPEREKGSSEEGTVEEYKDLYIHNFPKSTVAECMRTIRTNLLFMSPDRPLRTLVVTSPGPREGKTVTASNLASVMAQSNTRVLLVDTDMRRPRVHKVFNMVNDVGISSLMLGEVTYEEAIKPTPVPNLDVMCCGPIPPNPAELLHTERFQEVIRGLLERYDRVIFDSPPTIAVTDAMIISQLVDGLIFVVAGGRTARDVAAQAHSRLAGVNAPILGCILNQVDLGDRRYGQHYYYYRRYGQYYGQSEEEEDAA